MISHFILMSGCSVMTLVFLISSVSCVFAQARREKAQILAKWNGKAVMIYHWQMEQGLPNNAVQAMVQTRDGYLWLGTERGLVRFDGAGFTVFDKENTKEIRHNNILSLLEGRDGSLWIGTSGGLTRLKDGKFTSFTTKEGLLHDFVNPLFEDRQGNLWIGTRGGGLNCFKDGRFSHYTGEHGLSSMIVTSLVEDRAGNLWVGTDRGLNCFKDGKFIPQPTKERLATEYIWAIYEARDGTLWVGTNGGLARMKGEKLAVYTQRDGLSSDTVKAIYEDDEGVLWFGSNRGLNRFEDGRFSCFFVKDGLPADSVLEIYKTDRGGIFIGTSGGLALVRNSLFATYTSKEGLVNDDAHVILESRDGSIWIGTKTGLSRMKDGRFTNYTARNGLMDDEIRALAEDHEGNLWIGSDNGLLRFKDGHFTDYGEKEGLRVRAIHQDHTGRLWVGTFGAGLYCLKDGKLTGYSPPQFPSLVVRAIHEDRQGNVWFGGKNSLSCFKDGRFITYTTQDGLSSHYVYDIYDIAEDPDGTLWLGTYGGGLIRYKQGKFTNYTPKDGLFDKSLLRILDDGRENLWINSSKGIFRVSKQMLNDFAEGKIKYLTSVSYGTSGDTENSNCNGSFQPAGWRTRDGRLWFPTTKGVAIIDPGNLNINTRPLPIHIEKIVADDSAIDLTEKPEAIRLRPGTNRIEFSYTGVSLPAAEKVRFRYRLEGIDKNWIEAGSRRIAHYTNLSPGKYRFRVMAANEDGIWNEAGAFCDFHLAPYFYQTYWFYSFCGLLIVGMGWSVHQLRLKIVWSIHQLRLKQIEARFFVIQTERNRIAREMHDTLLQGIVGASALLGAVNKMMVTSPQQAGEYLELARDQLKESLDDIRMAISNLRDQTGDVKNLSNVINESIQRLTKGTPVSARCEVFGELQPVPYYVTENLVRIGCEAVGNAIRHAAPSNILVELQFDPQSIELRICDDGIGFDVHAPINDSKPHFGLVGMRERVAAMEGEFTLESQPGAGTKIKVRVPLQRGWMQAAA